MTHPKHTEPYRDGDQILMAWSAIKYGVLLFALAVLLIISAAHATPVQPAMAWRFCREHAADCAPGVPVTILSTERDRITDIGAAVNWRIRPVSGAAMMATAREPWRVIETDNDSGVCKDYAVTKLHDLRAAGYPIGAMSLAYVHVDGAPENLNHLVLVVRFSDGDYVLDNLTEVRWRIEERRDYTLISRTAWGNPGVWTDEGFGADENSNKEGL